MTESYGEPRSEKHVNYERAGVAIAKKSLESLVLRSANLVFATTNSSDLENLVEERNQFDWAFVEEAGKATGAELVTPLLLAPRRLMIGDHLQLPPFGEDRILALLDKPNAVKKALEIADEMVGRSFRDASVDEIFEQMRSGVNELQPRELLDVCEEAAKNFSLFQSLIETEYNRQKRNADATPIAVQLTEQHRMHPAIAEIVSHAFYDDTLVTEDSSRMRFSGGSSPIVSADEGRLPNSPVVWIDMPWISNTKNMKRSEQYPRFTNRSEIDAIQAVLKILRPAVDVRPSLAVLSPYSRQVRALADMVKQNRSDDLVNLTGFEPPSDDSHFCTTVDSFQGNEADCVVISLVRNNGYGSTRGALGFLADPRRMNVLMSRAKHRLIVVGSLDFLRSVYDNPKPQIEQQNLLFLGRLLKFFTDSSGRNDIKVVSFANLMGVEK